MGVLDRLDHELRSLVSNRAERRYDEALGLTTGGRHGHSAEAETQDAFEHAGIYQGVSPKRFAELVAALPLDPAQTTFIDHGSGKGKALLLAADHGFRRVIGVEFAPDLAELGARNARAYAAARPGAPPIESICADSGSWELPAEPTLLFLYNPFDAVVMERVVAATDASLRAHPRPLHVVYLNPKHPEPWTRSTELEPLPLPPHVLQPPALRRFRGIRGHEHGQDLAAVVLRARRAA